jgi:outer membrane protein assembly factor BamB
VRHRHRGSAVRLAAGGSLAALALAAAACSGPSSPATSPSPPASGTATSAAATSSAASATSASATSASATAAPAAPGAAPSATSSAGLPADWPAYHGDAARSGVSASLPAVRGALQVVKSVKLDGAVYASPIAADGVIVAATENDSVYAFSTSGQLLWHVSVGRPSPAYQRPCGDIDPLGITGTPVYSAQTGDVYVVAEHGGSAIGHDLVALNLHTGKVSWTKNIDLPGPAPAAMQQRGALTVTGGRVWASFGAEYGDCANYLGRVIGVPLDGAGSVTDFQPSANRQGGIWNPAGPTVDAAGNMYVVSANGSTFPGASYDHTNSVLEVSPAGKLLSSFAPADWAANNQGDVGLGSMGAALVGTQWVVLGGKSGPVYVLRQGQLGGIGGQVSGTDVCTPYGGPAVDGDVVYLPCTDGVRAVRVDSAGQLHVLWQASGSIAGSPVVGGGRVWALDSSGGVLYALNPVNGATLEQVSVGATSRFATPAIYGSLVLVPTLAGVVFVRA